MYHYNVPSIKRMADLLRIDLPTAKLARKVMEAATVSELEDVLGMTFYGVYFNTTNADKYAVTCSWYKQCVHRPGLTLVKMYMLNDLIGGYGVEGVSAGTNARSPQFEYVNMGDTYTTTILYVYGRGFKVMDYGSIVERGNYA